MKFIDLVGSTALSVQLDPEELRRVLQEYRATCATVIGRFAGYLAKYIGDGLLVYFGYPQAHEDDAARAVRAGLGIVAALPQLNARLQAALGAHRGVSLQVRIGIHTGLVVAGEMGVGDQPEPLAIVGETPNIAARVQGQAEPNTVVISQATYRLVQGLFECQELGPQTLKGLSTPLALYRVERESTAQSRFAVAVQKGLTPLVGREPELELLRQRWEQAKAGAGQVVLVSGDPGIGKSRLVQELKEQLAHEGVTHIEFRCSPYHQNSALYPIIDQLQRFLQFAREDSPATKLEKLQHRLSHYCFPQADTVPLLAALLSLPHPEGYPPITVSPQKQKEKTQAALVAWLVEEAERQPVYNTWEDVHWADPSTLEILHLYLDQVPTIRSLLVLTFRPEFRPPWGGRSHIDQLTLSRLGRSQVEALVERVTGGKTLSPEVVEQIVAKTDGVPLFVEELTKTVVEAMREQGTGDRGQGHGIIGAQHAVPVSLTIPATLHDSLMARLDRLGSAKEVAQLGATLGREFAYELIQAVSPIEEASLQQVLAKLVEAEVLYQRGLPPQTHYLFKHALIQDAAYQSLLKRTRQQYHQQIAQALQEKFSETKENQPELLAHHYTEAGLIAQAIPYWQQAGQRASQRSAYVEAVSHLTKGLELIRTLPDTPERAQQELTLQIVLGPALMTTNGYAAPEVEQAYARARELCQQVGETPQLFSVLWGLFAFYVIRGSLRTARELGEQILNLARRVQDPALLVAGHQAPGAAFYFMGEFIPAREHLEQAIAFYHASQKPAQIVSAIGDRGMVCLSYAAGTLWFLGYPDQALKHTQEALALARRLSHPFTLTYALTWAAVFHRYRGEVQQVQELVEAVIAISQEQRFPAFLAQATILQGWVLARQGQGEEGIMQMRQGLTALQATGTDVFRPHHFASLVEAYGQIGQAGAGLAVIEEMLAEVDRNGNRFYEAELYRLKGELLLKKPEVRSQKSEARPQSLISNTQHQTPSTQAEAEAEACFLKAIEVTRKQQAKSLELRATVSLARLWQQQGKKAEAHQMLFEIYNWFTEGFDTKALQEAKALLEELG